jgi:2-polyprenyl-3-methyl-5-hydroxy-6-metoxy-1,4-benzoquinol methylase
MKKVAILIPASPNLAFFSQIAASALALSRLDWQRWEPTVYAFLGGEPDFAALEAWPYLRDTMMTFVPASLSEAHRFYYAQIDSLFRCAPVDADVLVRMDADTLAVRNFEDLLDYVAETNSVAGVTAHFPFPTWPGVTPRQSWVGLAHLLTGGSIGFEHAYSLPPADAVRDEWATPFYVNDGVVLFAGSVFADVVRRYLRFRPDLMDRTPGPYFSGQIALALAIAQAGVQSCALPMRYNFPNDELAETRYPEELDNVCIFHYLRTHAFDRHNIFSNATAYHEFLELSLTGSNKVFQSCVSNLIGSEYPFALSSEPVSAIAGAASARPTMVPAAHDPAIPEEPPRQRRDMSAEDLGAALAASDRADLLRELVDVSHAAFGFFADQFTYTINYPWVAARLEGLPAGSRVLDFGAGVSPMPLWLADRGVLVDTVDNHPIERTLPSAEDWNAWGFFDYRQLRPNVASHHCAIAEFTPVSRFDAVYSVCVLAHMPRATREDTLRRCHGWLQSGGRLLLTIDLIPATDFLWNRSEGREVEPLLVHGTVAELLCQLASIGFRLNESRVLRTLPRSRTDVLLIDCTAT